MEQDPSCSSSVARVRVTAAQSQRRAASSLVTNLIPSDSFHIISTSSSTRTKKEKGRERYLAENLSSECQMLIPIDLPCACEKERKNKKASQYVYKVDLESKIPVCPSLVITSCELFSRDSLSSLNVELLLKRAWATSGGSTVRKGTIFVTIHVWCCAVKGLSAVTASAVGLNTRSSMTSDPAAQRGEEHQHELRTGAVKKNQGVINGGQRWSLSLFRARGALPSSQGECLFSFRY
ncbi:uncharacterized protein V6R79_015046 [Siganus canaliculatus]